MSALSISAHKHKHLPWPRHACAATGPKAHTCTYSPAARRKLLCLRIRSHSLLLGSRAHLLQRQRWDMQSFHSSTSAPLVIIISQSSHNRASPPMHSKPTPSHNILRAFCKTLHTHSVGPQHSTTQCVLARPRTTSLSSSIGRASTNRHNSQPNEPDANPHSRTSTVCIPLRRRSVALRRSAHTHTCQESSARTPPTDMYSAFS